MQLIDSYNRTIDYVRIGVTDRCNLRCFYCMPKEGIPYEPKAYILSYEEIIRLLGILGDLGFSKVRFTGGEPFLRKDFDTLLQKTSELGFYDKIRITTNGTLIQKHIPLLKSLGIKTINLSLDSLDEWRFNLITRRNDFQKVINTLYSLLSEGFYVKVNAVIMNEINNQDILPMVALAQNNNVSIRFIEEMPFNGGYKKNTKIFTAKDIAKTIKDEHPSFSPKQGKPGDTATNYTIEGFKGEIGIIPAFSRTFCNTCNRLRITPKGDIKTCLYDGGVFSIRDFMRNGATDNEIREQFIRLVRLKPKDGFEAEQDKKQSLVREESMSTIGG